MFTDQNQTQKDSEARENVKGVGGGVQKTPPQQTSHKDPCHA